MATTTGTALNYRDLLLKLRTFLTTTMLPASERWTELRYTSATEDELILKAPGLAGTEQIFIGIQTASVATNGTYNWLLNGFVGYNAANAFAAQPGAISGLSPALALWNGAIPYWFVASGRRVVVVAKVSTVYEAAYLGLIKPYATPGQYPYPLLIGGSMTGAAGYSYTLASVNHRHFIDPGEVGNAAINTACMLRGPGGAWLAFQNYAGSDTLYSLTRQTWPYHYTNLHLTREALDGSYVLTPALLTEYVTDMDRELYGELDGCYQVSGFGNAAENLITVNGVSHLVVQNVNRTTVRDYWALALV